MKLSLERGNYYESKALDKFESLVLSQQPAKERWQPVTDYSFEARKAIEGQHPQLIKDVFNPTRVCDAGMGPGHLVHLLRDLGVTAFGFDTQRTGTCYGDLSARTLSAVGRPYNTWGFIPRSFDLVLCREVLEHLTVLQIRHAVTNLCELSSKFVYLTTRFAEHPVSLIDFDVHDDLDPTHCTMLNQDFLRVLFILEGFKRRADLEQRMDWKKLGRCLVYERAA